MTKPAIALCSATSIAFDGDTVPEWIHLIPAGEVRTMDGRGPYRVADAAALMAASLGEGDKLVLDENHATDLAAPRGETAPARGWIVELQNRDTGIWGRVEWTGEGRRLMQDKAYRGISPAISHRKDGVVTRILRASLVNAPNLTGLASLHQEGHQDMDWKSKLIELLGLDSEAADDAIVAAITEKMKEGGEEAVLQAALAPIAKAVGLPETADAPAVLAGVQRLASSKGDAVTALQSELASVTTQLNSVTEKMKRDTATAYVDGALREGRVGLKPVRDEYISMHMEDPERVKRLVGAMPVLNSTQPFENRDPDPRGLEDPTLLAAEATKYQKKLADSGQVISFSTAVLAVKEGKHK